MKIFYLYISLAFCYLSELIFSGFLQFKGYFVRDQNISNFRDFDFAQLRKNTQRYSGFVNVVAYATSKIYKWTVYLDSVQICFSLIIAQLRIQAMKS